MANGRRFDAHNAKLVYHGILVRGMLEAYRALDESDAFRKPLRDALVRALDNAATEIRLHGASAATTATEMFCGALAVLGSNESWQTALNICVNAGLHAARDRQAPHPGLSVADYILYATSRDKGR
jgi:hypothetical protein